MSLFIKVMVGIRIVSLICSPFYIGKEREPITPGAYVIGLVLDLVILYGLFNWI